MIDAFFTGSLFGIGLVGFLLGLILTFIVAVAALGLLSFIIEKLGSAITNFLKGF